MSTRIFRTTLLVLALAALVSPFFAGIQVTHAQAYIPLAPIETGTEGLDFTGCSEAEVGEGRCLGKYLRTLYNIGIAIAGLFAVLSIVRGGFELVWTESFVGHSEAKGIILRAVGGLLIVFSSYILMNVISPALGRDLDLNLKFPTITVEYRKDDRLIKSLSKAQLEHMRREIAERNGEEREKIKNLDAELPQLQAALAAAKARNDIEEERRLTFEIEANREERARSELVVGAINVERDVSASGLAAESSADAEAALSEATKEGGNLDKIKQGYNSYRTAVANNPAKVVESYTGEFDRVGVANKQLAFSIIDNPPQKKTEVTIERSGMKREVFDDDFAALHNLVAERIKAIEDERRRITLSLNAVDVNGNANLQTDINRRRAAINQRANGPVGEICQIKSRCKEKGYACQNLAPSVTCTYD